jgi:hypothetical protein
LPITLIVILMLLAIIGVIRLKEWIKGEEHEER